MKKESGLQSKILKGAAVGGAAISTGYGGYKIGEKSGATRTADKMTAAFSEANQKENRHIIDSFKAFNEKENLHILRKGFQMGREYKGMDKKAALEEIYDAAFQDEIEKIAVSLGGLYTGTRQSVKTLASGLKRNLPGLINKETRAASITGLKDTAKGSQRALALLGAAGIGGAFGTGYLAGR